MQLTSRSSEMCQEFLYIKHHWANYNLCWFPKWREEPTDFRRRSSQRSVPKTLLWVSCGFWYLHSDHSLVVEARNVLSFGSLTGCRTFASRTCWYLVESVLPPICAMFPVAAATAQSKTSSTPMLTRGCTKFFKWIYNSFLTVNEIKSSSALITHKHITKHVI